MRLARAIGRPPPPHVALDAPVIVDIVGGLGSQVLSAAAYFYQKRLRSSVFVDTSYFDAPAHIAGPGQGCSHWPWALDIYGLYRSSFPDCGTQRDIDKRSPMHVIRVNDGVPKTKFALLGLMLPEIRNHFPLLPAAVMGGLCSRYAATDFAFIHVRQGDYLNVASHVVSPSEAVALLGPLRRLVDVLIISSDSPLSDDFLDSCRAVFSSCDVLIDHNLAETHWLMRKASILVTSNSTLSLTAAFLNEGGLVLGPPRWFGHHHSELEDEVLRYFSWRCLTPTV